MLPIVDTAYSLLEDAYGYFAYSFGQSGADNALKIAQSAVLKKHISLASIESPAAQLLRYAETVNAMGMLIARKRGTELAAHIMLIEVLDTNKEHKGVLKWEAIDIDIRAMVAQGLDCEEAIISFLGVYRGMDRFDSVKYLHKLLGPTTMPRQTATINR